MVIFMLCTVNKMLSIFKKMKTLFYLAYFLCIASCTFYKFPPRVVTPLGTIIGKTVYFTNIPVNTFQSIPFAKPPLGEYRFKKPVPMDPWKQPLVADRLPPACVQFSSNPFPWLDSLPGHTQDCLYLNIWTPSTAKPFNKKAVMFWILGGGFRIGSSRLDYYDGRALTYLGDVVVVSTNYRLGPEGFLYSGTDDAPGNMGLHDILAALKWVNSYIKYFGGDEDNVTLFGQSSGAIAAGMLMVSPLARGLFVRTIMQSGSPANLDAEDNGRNFKLSQSLAQEVGCAPDGTSLRDNPEAVISCLRSKDALELLKAVGKVSDNPQRDLYPQFGDDILPENARVALIKGNFSNVDVLIGNDQNEGATMITKVMKKTFGFYGEKNPLINKTFGEHIIRQNFRNFPDVDAVVNHYLGKLKEDDYEDVLYQVQTASGDYARVCPCVYFGETVAKKGNRVYFYFFVRRRAMSPWAPWMGVPHFEETPFVFGYPLMYPSNYTAEDINLSWNMIKIWTSFARTGQQILQLWPLYSSKHLYHTLDTGIMNIDIGPHFENCEFFRQYFGF